MRKEFCLKDKVLITYTEKDICFEEIETAESVLIDNDYNIIHSNFDDAKNQYYIEYLKKIFSAITSYRNLEFSH